MAYGKQKATSAKYSVTQLVALSIIAYRLNNDAVGKIDDELVDPAKVEPILSNKTHVYLMLHNQYAIPEETMNEAAGMIQFLQSTASLRALLGRKITGFSGTLIEATQEEEVTSQSVGLLVYVPSVYDTFAKRQVVDDVTNEHKYVSKPLGAVGAKVTVDFELIEKRWIERIGCFTAYGKDKEGNLIQFLTNKEALCASGTISGKIKSFENNTYRNNAMVTSLNYVKMLVAA